MASLTDSSVSSAPQIEDVIITSGDGSSIISSNGKNLESVENMYGSDVLSLILDATESGKSGYIKKNCGSDKLIFVAEPLTDIGYNGYAGLIVSDYESLYDYFFTDYKQIIIFVIIAFVCGSLLGALYFFLESRDIRLLQKVLAKIASGEDNVEKPAALGRDMNYMWNSIFEIHKNVLETNRIKFLTYEAYYRFAPKSVERILGRDSITEVQSGDSVNLSGTIALVSTRGVRESEPNNLDRIAGAFGLMEELRKLYDGIFISQDSLLSSTKYLFLQGNKDATAFGTDLVIRLREDLKEKNAAVILHHTQFAYGVSGTENQTGIYLSSPESDVLFGYAGWLKEHGVSLAVTGALNEYENSGSDMRYIGFILMPGMTDKKIDIYEVLDAESAADHSTKQRNSARFKEALELFYNRDFYFARNMFTEILKESQTDGITRWYLFECEKYLSETHDSFTGALDRRTD